MLAVFLFSCTTTFGFASWTADQIVLRCVYGAEAVRRDQLRIASHRPLRVSNGDRLEGWGFRIFLIILGIWFPLTLGILFVLRWGLPREYREMMKEHSSRDKGLPGVTCLLVIPTVLLVICLSPSFVASGLAAFVAFALAWIITGRPAPPSDSAPDRH
jgi:hypothetical protein